ncbi:MAG TPA: hypothetical protein VGK81_03990, partial [Anaerolineae bacterium]
ADDCVVEHHGGGDARVDLDNAHEFVSRIVTGLLLWGDSLDGQCALMASMRRIAGRRGATHA